MLRQRLQHSCIIPLKELWQPQMLCATEGTHSSRIRSYAGVSAAFTLTVYDVQNRGSFALWILLDAHARVHLHVLAGTSSYWRYTT